jgi:cyclohexanecarboxylate-CoA ligase
MARWSPQVAVDLVRDEGVTFMMGPPTFFQTMLAAPNFTPDAVATMRLISCGGAGVTPAFVEAASSGFGAVVKRTYGSTEAPVVTTWHAGDPPERTGDSDGRAAGEIELHIADPGPDGSGELWLRGPELFVGYSDPARNDGTITDDDWFRTGDVATLTRGADGHEWLRIVGRLKDIIIRGGENISAAEVEGVLESHPAVAQAVAVGYPDERLGERVCAFVVCRDPGGGPGATFDLDACRRWFEAAGVTRFKWPERVELLRDLPVLASSGKADRAELRRRAARMSQRSQEI